MSAEKEFPRRMAELRRKKGLSQRKAAGDLHISQALLSHYENGAREPGLAFLCRACDYFQVTADYLLGRSEEEQKPDTASLALEQIAGQLRELAQTAERAAQGQKE